MIWPLRAVSADGADEAVDGHAVPGLELLHGGDGAACRRRRSCRPSKTPATARRFCRSLTSLPRAPGHIAALPKCSVLSTTNVCLSVTTLPPLSLGRDDHRVLALGEVLDREHGARRRSVVLARLAVEHQLELGVAELIAGLDADLEARVPDGLAQLSRLERGGAGVDVDAQLLGGGVARPVGGGDGDVRGPVGQVGADRVLAARVGLAAGLDAAPPRR